MPGAGDGPTVVSSFVVHVDGRRMPVRRVDGVKLELAVTSRLEPPRRDPRGRVGGGLVRQLLKVRRTPLVLTAAVREADPLWDWWTRAREGAKAVAVDVVLLDAPAGEPVVRWEYRECRPTAWRTPTLDALVDDVAEASLVVTYADLVRLRT